MDQIGPDGRVTTIIHFSINNGDGERVACMPNMVELHTTQHHLNFQRSNDHRAVSCRQCMESSTFKMARSR